MTQPFFGMPANEVNLLRKNLIANDKAKIVKHYGIHLDQCVQNAIAVRPQAFGFEESPIAALIELDEGLRFVSNVEDVNEEDMDIGIRVKVAFADTSGGKKVPIFKPVSE